MTLTKVEERLQQRREDLAQVSMFPSLGSVLVQAHRPYVRALLEQAEVSGAMLNSDAGSR